RSATRDSVSGREQSEPVAFGGSGGRRAAAGQAGAADVPEHEPVAETDPRRSLGSRHLVAGQYRAQLGQGAQHEARRHGGRGDARPVTTDPRRVDPRRIRRRDVLRKGVADEYPGGPGDVEHAERGVDHERMWLAEAEPLRHEYRIDPGEEAVAV